MRRGRCCCVTGCEVCAIDEWEVVISGINTILSGCADCTDLNGTYLLPFFRTANAPGYNRCEWVYELPAEICGINAVRLYFIKYDPPYYDEDVFDYVTHIIAVSIATSALATSQVIWQNVYYGFSCSYTDETIAYSSQFSWSCAASGSSTAVVSVV